MLILNFFLFIYILYLCFLRGHIYGIGGGGGITGIGGGGGGTGIAELGAEASGTEDSGSGCGSVVGAGVWNLSSSEATESGIDKTSDASSEPACSPSADAPGTASVSVLELTCGSGGATGTGGATGAGAALPLLT